MYPNIDFGKVLCTRIGGTSHHFELARLDETRLNIENIDSNMDVDVSKSVRTFSLLTSLTEIVEDLVVQMCSLQMYKRIIPLLWEIVLAQL